MVADVFIDYGLCDWEIKQNHNGFSEINVGGRYEFKKESDGEEIPTNNPQVMVRVVNEETDEPITEWSKAASDSGKWNISLKIPIGGPYRLSTILKFYDNSDWWIERNPSGDDIHHFCVGDIYLIAGQSNAVGVGRGVLTDSPVMGVHVLRNCKKWDIATNPFYRKRGFHGPFLSFAKYLKKSLNCPIGLIPCAYGGSQLCDWLKTESGHWYDEMIKVITSNHIDIKGILWYQGCSDAAWGDPTDYLERFKQLVENVRCDLNNKMPIITFQLNRHTDDANKETDDNYDYVRECQRRAAREISDVFIVPTIDSGKLTDGIHNSRAANVLLGERAALLALNIIYNKGLDFFAPDIESARLVAENTVKLEFSHVSDCLMAFHVAASDLPIMVEDVNGVNQITDYDITKNTILLYLKNKVQGKCTVKCQYGRNPKGYIQDIGKQMPILCFSNMVVEE